MTPPQARFPTNSESSRGNGSQRLVHQEPVLILDDTDCCKLLAADVVCGGPRERMSVAHHPGNKRFREMIALKRESYQKASSQNDRMEVIKEAMKTVRNSGGRFLRRNPRNAELQEMEEGLARELVQKAFEYVPKAIPKMPERTQAPLTRTVSEENNSGDEEARFQTILSDQRKIFEALMKKRGMDVP